MKIYSIWWQILLLIFFIAPYHTTQAQTSYYWSTGTYDTYVFEMRKKIAESDAVFAFKENEGAFELSWSENTEDLRAGVGLLQSTGEEVIEFAADIESHTNSYISTFGVFLDTAPSAAEIKYLAEFSIIENSIGWDMTKSMTPIDSIYSDGSYYVLFSRSIFYHHVVESYNYNYYYFVRRNNRTAGTVTFNNHYKKLLEIFEENGQRGELLYALFGVEALLSSGFCDMYTLIINSGFPEDPDVEFVSLQENDEFSIGDEIFISADITPKQGSIEKVEYFAGDNKIGETVAAPHEIVWMPDVIGSVPITIVATDTEGWDTKKVTTIIIKATVHATIELFKGWNIVGYVKDGALPEIALATIWDNVEMVKDFESFYEKGQKETLNSLKELQFGKGYLVKVTDNCLLEW